MDGGSANTEETKTGYEERTENRGEIQQPHKEGRDPSWKRKGEKICIYLECTLLGSSDWKGSKESVLSCFYDIFLKWPVVKTRAVNPFADRELL